MEPQIKPINISTLFSFNSEYCCDSIEWCPHEPQQNIFVCGNYQLIETQNDTEGSNKRIGKILLMSANKNHLKLCQEIRTPAVLDQKWCHNKIHDKTLLGVVNAAKKVEIYNLNTDSVQLELIADYQVDTDITETLVLSLDWATGIIKVNEPDIISSDSKGNIHLLKLNNSGLNLQSSYHGHDSEAWIAGFYYWDPNIFFSGGDDCLFLKYDKRAGNEPVAKNRRHIAGVTSLHSNPFKEYLLATGSYDEYIRIWDIRNMKSESETIKMPDTLWRLKWAPFSKNHLLAACMRGGVHILDIEKMNIIGSYEGHKSISYGADWCFLNKDRCSQFDSSCEFIIGSCSFYDCLICVSKCSYK